MGFEPTHGFLDRDGLANRCRNHLANPPLLTLGRQGYYTLEQLQTKPSAFCLEQSTQHLWHQHSSAL